MVVPYRKIVSDIAEEGWGNSGSVDIEQQKKDILRDKPALASYALLEILNRMTEISRAAGPKDWQDNKQLTLSEYNKAFPHSKVGDFLYQWDVDEGITKSLIISKDDNHFCQVVDISWVRLTTSVYSRFASDDDFDNAIDAVRNVAPSDIKHHGPRYEYAKRALAAAEAGDVSEFADGIPDEEEAE